MSLSEFALIERYFRKAGAMRSDVHLGVGDDAALLQCPPGAELVAAMDTLVEGVHFPRGSPPASIGHRVLAVNLSDLAAMGARPAWALLALTLPEDRRDVAGGIYSWLRSARSRSRCCTRRWRYNIRSAVGDHPDPGSCRYDRLPCCAHAEDLEIMCSSRARLGTPPQAWPSSSQNCPHPVIQTDTCANVSCIRHHVWHSGIVCAATRPRA